MIGTDGERNRDAERKREKRKMLKGQKNVVEGTLARTKQWILFTRLQKQCNGEQNIWQHKENLNFEMKSASPPPLS